MSINRPIVGSTAAGVGIKYIPVDRYNDDLSIQCDAIGTVTFTVDWTNDNIYYNTAAQSAINLQPREGLKDPTAAIWGNLIASGSVDVSGTAGFPVNFLRINITVGAGSVNYVINQS
jgi:hypothetical protein